VSKHIPYYTFSHFTELLF